MARNKENTTSADTNFKTARNSGYTGQLNQDGERPTEANTDPQTLAIYQRAAAAFTKHRS